MATTHKVVKGDTLWAIAQKYLGSGSKYKQLAAINNIPNPDLIYVGQVIKLTSTSGGGSSSTTSSNSNAVTINQFGLLSTSDNTLFATWTWGKENKTESYKIAWSYTTIDGVTFTDNLTSNTVDSDFYAASRQSTYAIPSGAVKVTFKVKPISKKYKSGNTEKSYWTANWSTLKTHTVSTPLDAPSAPSIELKELKLTAELENLDTIATAVQFRLVKNKTSIVETSKAISINKNTGYVSYVWPAVDTGCEYSVRCRFVRDALYSEWSPLSSSVRTRPDAPKKIITCKATDDDVVYLEWSKSTAATKYDIEYTTNQDYFDKAGDTTTVTTENEGTGYYITGMTSGEEYFFRVRAVNDSGESEWTEVISLKLGEPPAAPTTWSSTTTAIIGEDVVLYWNHNSEDGSSQTFAELMIYIDGVAEPSIIIENDRSEDDKDKTSSYSIDTTPYTEGVKMEWMVRTAGITQALGEWSIKRTIDIHAQPTLKLSVTDAEGNPLEAIAGFPFYISAIPGPKTQKPIGYHLSIASNEIYETVDNVGNPIIVNKDQKIYSRYFDTNFDLLVAMSAGNVDLEKNVSYTVSCVVSMDSGLTAEATRDIFVDWDETVYSPNASIGIDEDSYTAYIQPYCEDRTLVYKQVSKNYNTYAVTDTVLDYAWGEPETDAYTETGEQVYYGADGDGNELYFCQVEEVTVVENILLSVYRREFDGSFTEIATGLDNTKNVTVTDPHPALDYARYRIVATSTETGAVGYSDLPGYPVNGKSIIIQWDEEWSSFNTTSEDALEQPPWSGSLLKLPYNVDVSDKYAPDVTKVSYIGRSHPVTYYGTYQGHTASWGVSIEASDTETLYALRRLAVWMGDVYVREPSGSGYWANVAVSFNQTHCELTIPVTIDVTRVEGGV